MTNPTDLLVSQISASLAICDANTKAVNDRTAQLEAEGYTIVTHAWDATNGDWEIINIKTDDVLASGNGMDEYNAAWDSEWFHEDVITEEVTDLDVPASEGIPDDLAEIIHEWVESNEEEARAFIVERSIAA